MLWDCLLCNVCMLSRDFLHSHAVASPDRYPVHRLDGVLAKSTCS